MAVSDLGIQGVGIASLGPFSSLPTKKVDQIAPAVATWFKWLKILWLFLVKSGKAHSRQISSCM
jgi:hypothetical protein